MKISELIEDLNKAKEELGDVEVVSYYDYHGHNVYTEVGYVNWNPSENRVELM